MLDNKKISAVLALGYFDSVHLGHQKVIGTAKKLAKKLNTKTVVITFSGNLRAKLGNQTEKMVFTPNEREEFMKKLGVDEVYFAPTTDEFLALDKKAFLTYLNEIYNVLGYVCGEDYKFGKLGLGNRFYLEEFAKEKGQIVKVVEMENFKGNEISTTLIKGLLKDGKVKESALLLGRNYSVSGKVFADRKIGSSIGFPTINLKINKDKFRLKNGVYEGRINLYGKEYKAIINYGARPTFSLDEKLIEAHIVDFSGELYDMDITLFFTDYLRDIIKFNSVEELKEQLKKDLQTVKGKK